LGGERIGSDVKRAKVYDLQNRAIHEARAELERKAILEAGRSLDVIRELAGKINLGINSISRLSLKQREILIEQLKEMGATVRNPHIYDSDLTKEWTLSGKKERRKIVLFSEPKEDQLRMVDAIAAQISWHEQDGYTHFCRKFLKSPRPRNSREVTKLRLALESILEQQRKKTGS
jgi:hypothetical protein